MSQHGRLQTGISRWIRQFNGTPLSTENYKLSMKLPERVNTENELNLKVARIKKAASVIGLPHTPSRRTLFSSLIWFSGMRRRNTWWTRRSQSPIKCRIKCRCCKLLQMRYCYVVGWRCFLALATVEINGQLVIYFTSFHVVGTWLIWYYTVHL